MWGYERYKGNLYLPLSFVNKPKTAIKKNLKRKTKQWRFSLQSSDALFSNFPGYHILFLFTISSSILVS